MRKILCYFFMLILICFAIPIIFTSSKNKETASQNVANEQIPEITYDYKRYSKIKLYHTATKKTQEIPIDEYLYGVVSAEMPASFEEEALKAQAVVARTYTLYKIVNSSKHKGADICDSYACCQAWISKEDRLKKWEESKRDEYWNKIVKAVNTTQGKIITYEGKPINAFFHSNSGGATESPINVWGGSNYPYLQTVTTAGEDAYKQYKSSVSVTKKEFEEKIKKLHSDFKIDFKQKDCIKIEEYTEGRKS